MVKIISIIIIHCRLLCNEFKKDIKKNLEPVLGCTTSRSK